MVRPETQLDSSVRSDTVESVIDGQDIREVSEDLAKEDLRDLADDYEALETELRDAGIDYLEEVGVDIQETDVSVTVVATLEDIDHLERDLKTDERGAYIPGEGEALVFTHSAPGAQGLARKAVDPVGTVAHEFKHYDQDVKTESSFDDSYPVSEAVTQLLNLYRKGDLDDYSKAKRTSRELEDSIYSDGELLAEETELGVEVYHNMIESGKDHEEAISFIMNEYEDRRMEYMG